MDARRDAAIGDALGFTPEELALNRQQRLSDRQRVTLTTNRSRGRAGTMVIALVVVVFAVLIVVFLVPKLTASQATSASVPIVPIVIGVLVLMFVVMGLSMFRTRRSLDQMASGKLQLAAGPAKTRAHRLPGNVVDSSAPGLGYGGGIRYELTIGSVRFFVPGQAVLDAFEDGHHYRGYYVGRGVMNTLLSAEHA